MPKADAGYNGPEKTTNKIFDLGECPRFSIRDEQPHYHPDQRLHSFTVEGDNRGVIHLSEREAAWLRSLLAKSDKD